MGGRFEKTYIDVRVFNPLCSSNRSNLKASYRKHEMLKKRAYDQRIRDVEHASFTPVVLSATGGLANEATAFYKRLASLLSSKWRELYSVVICWVRCHLSFSLIRSAIQCFRGSRSSASHFVHPPASITLAKSEAGFSQ